MPENRPYVWSPRAGRYRDPATGRFLSLAHVRNTISRSLVNAELAITSLGYQLRDSAISLIQWEIGMRQLLKDTALYNLAVAKGGWAQLNPNDYGRVGAHLQTQYKYLRRFGNQIASGEQALDGRFFQRVRMYAKEGRSLYHRAEVDEHIVRGFTRYRSVLHPADHCDECVEEASKGFVTIGELIPIGSRTCRSNDRCSYEYEGALP